ncbi:MAG TPA: GvpL/GvpF family gas vesicle protein [Thermoanaerobaculia bacterium]|nr:GvpL/GvpF family gas vesicle protein [Thermoanaerobaculia bacterium]
MSHLYLYAIVGPGDRGDLGLGLAGEPLRLIGGGPVCGVAGSLPEKPQPVPPALAAHDAVVRRLSEQIAALLPARFGQTLPDEQALTDWLAAHAPELAEALVQVAGCVQMTLRVYGEAQAMLPDVPDVPPAGGPGTRYLEQRRRETERERSLPEIAPLREALRPLLKAERIERPVSPAAAGRLRATAYDLIARGASDDYARIVAAVSSDGRLAGWHVAASGPWPPYAFAPGLVR